jgi:hypothetical protein
VSTLGKIYDFPALSSSLNKLNRYRQTVERFDQVFRRGRADDDDLGSLVANAPGQAQLKTRLKFRLPKALKRGIVFRKKKNTTLQFLHSLQSYFPVVNKTLIEKFYDFDVTFLTCIRVHPIRSATPANALIRLVASVPSEARLTESIAFENFWLCKSVYN